MRARLKIIDIVEHKGSQGTTTKNQGDVHQSFILTDSDV